VPLQLTPLTWRPHKNLNTPVLVMAAADDALFSVEDEQTLVRHYKADFHLIPDTAHNAMIEPSYRESARALHDWLVAKGIE
jgi:pimeloyl-ACP methyl ester carboxylesterase